MSGTDLSTGDIKVNKQIKIFTRMGNIKGTQVKYIVC